MMINHTTKEAETYHWKLLDDCYVGEGPDMLNQAMDNLATRLAEVSGRHLVVESQLNVSHLIME